MSGFNPVPWIIITVFAIIFLGLIDHGWRAHRHNIEPGKQRVRASVAIFLLHAGRVLFEGCLVVFVAFYLLEYPHIRKVMGDELKQILDPAQEELFEKLEADQQGLVHNLGKRVEVVLGYKELFGDPAFLRQQRYEPSALNAFRDAVWEVFSGRRPIPEEETLQDLVYTQLEGPVRTNMELYRQLNTAKSQTDVEHFLVVDQYSVVYRFSKDLVRFPAPFGARVKAIDGVDTRDLYQVTEFTVNGESLEPPTPKYIQSDGNELEFVYETAVQVAGAKDQAAAVSWKTESRVPLDDNFINRMGFPTRGLDVTVGFNESRFDVSLVVFALRDGVVYHDTPIKGSQRWTTDAWFMRNHGWKIDVFEKNR